MAELLVSYTTPTKASSGELYYARTFGRVADDGLWDGWIEFTRAGDDEVVCTERETKQPNRADLTYWAQGLTGTYLEGALERAIRPPTPVRRQETRQFSNAAPRSAPRRVAGIPGRVVLNPFTTYAEGEELLRKQLGALSHDHLQTIVETYQFATPDDPNWARTASEDALVERIVDRVRERFAAIASETAPAAAADQRNATEQGRSE